MTDARTAAMDARDARSQGAGDDHPAPERGRVPLSLLWFGFLGAPAAWSVQTLVNLPLTSHACFPSLTPLTTPVVDGVRGIAFAVSLVALVVCVAATAVAWRTWRRTRGEHQQRAGRGQEHEPGSALLETGEGRTRFMALGGVLTSLTFLALSVIHTAAIFLVPPCG